MSFSTSVQQLTHTQTVNSSLALPIIVVAENVQNPENIGMIFRVSDAFGVKKIWFCGENIPFLNTAKIRKTSRSTLHKVPYEICPHTAELIVRLQAEKRALIGLELTNQSQIIRNYNFRQHTKIALFIGSERHGLSENTLQNMEACVQIPLFGKNSSMNVVNALSIGLYEITTQ